MAPKRRVFYSFHYEFDYWRTFEVRNIGAIEGSKPVYGNGWEVIKRGGDNAIQEWIDEQMKNRSCTIVLVGSHTAERKWVKYKIVKSWYEGKGVAGIYIHGLKDSDENISYQGNNPFHYVNDGDGRPLSSIVKCYDPTGQDSKEKYDWVTENIEAVIETALEIRKNN